MSLIGALGVTGGVAAANQAEPNRLLLRMPDVEATASTLQQDCVKAGLVMPEITRAVMKHPGHRLGRTQEVLVDAAFNNSLPKGCEGKFERESGFQTQFRYGGRWFHYAQPAGLYYGNEAGVGKDRILPAAMRTRDILLTASLSHLKSGQR